jgi:hypothetical protein
MRLQIPLMLLSALALPAVAQQTPSPDPPPAVRAARTDDLPGLWVMVALSKHAEVDVEDSLFAPYQLFYFDPNGGMKHMTSAQMFRQSQLAVFDAAPLVTRFTVDRRGTLLLMNPAWDAPRSYLCRLVIKDTPGDDPRLPRAGDILLSGTDGQGRPLWSKLLRKLNP